MSKIGEWVQVKKEPIGQFVSFGEAPYNDIPIVTCRYIIQYRLPLCRWETCWMISKDAAIDTVYHMWRDQVEKHTPNEIRLLQNLDIPVVTIDEERYSFAFKIIKYVPFARSSRLANSNQT